jgi:lysophospholipase L1-like esterase
MANYRKIIALRPEMTDFLANRRKIGFRGDVLSYGRDIRNDSFSTDSQGFRHTIFQQQPFGLSDSIQHGRYGIVLGSSINFGFGVAGNENTAASLLSERFGFPFINAAMPGANSRDLHALLVGLIATAPAPPVVVVHSSGGDLGNFCETSIADPIFGTPNSAQLHRLKKGVTRTGLKSNFPGLIKYSTLWISVIHALCRAHGVPLVLYHQTSIFEKEKPTKAELESELGKPYGSGQERQFANHRSFNGLYFERRKFLAQSLGIPLAGWGLDDRLTFIDEVHCDADGTRLMAEALADAIEPLLSDSNYHQAEAELASSD